MQRGTEVTARAYKGALLRRRVWRDAGAGVLLCSEEAYQRAAKTGEEPLWSGFPKGDIVQVHGVDVRTGGVLADSCKPADKTPARHPLVLEEVVEAALQTKPMTPEEKAALEEEYRKRERKAPGRKKGR